MSEPSFVDCWYDKASFGHQFKGRIDDRDLRMHPQEVIAKVKQELVAMITAQIMRELGPRIDAAIKEAWQKPNE